jgi:hypothetical protein
MHTYTNPNSNHGYYTEASQWLIFSGLLVCFGNSNWDLCDCHMKWKELSKMQDENIADWKACTVIT